MRKDEFIQTTRALINQRVFMGRSNQLQESLRLLCDALENNTLILANRVSAQVTAGWWAEAQMQMTSAGSSGYITPEQAWTFLFSAIGNLDNKIYKATLRDRLEEAFRYVSCSEEVKQFWRETLKNQSGPALESGYQHLERVIPELDVRAQVTDPSQDENEQKISIYIREYSPGLIRGQWVSIISDLELGISNYSGNPAVSNSYYQIEYDLKNNTVTILDKLNRYNPVTDVNMKAQILSDFAAELNLTSHHRP